ncbi:hypothetical protein Tco_0982176 [Tanacetum coccineum]
MSNTNNNSDAMETKDTVSACSISKDQEIQRLQEKARLSKRGCMNGLKALQSHFTSLSDVLKDFETAFSKLVKESNIDSETKDVHAIKYKMSKEKERCMEYFRSLHSRLQVLSKENLKGTRIEHGFKRAFLSLFGQDNETFSSTMFLNVDQLQKQLDKDEFKEDRSMAAFWVLNNQFKQFIDSRFSSDCDS